MASTEQQLKDLVDGIRDGLPKIAARVDGLTASIVDLKTQIANGVPGPVSPAQLDDLIAETSAISSVIATLGTVPDAAPTQAPVQVAEPPAASPAAQ